MLCVHVVGSIREIKLPQLHRLGNLKDNNNNYDELEGSLP
jgi:hypothetical protein